MPLGLNTKQAVAEKPVKEKKIKKQTEKKPAKVEKQKKSARTEGSASVCRERLQQEKVVMVDHLGDINWEPDPLDETYDYECALVGNIADIRVPLVTSVHRLDTIALSGRNRNSAAVLPSITRTTPSSVAPSKAASSNAAPNRAVPNTSAHSAAVQRKPKIESPDTLGPNNLHSMSGVTAQKNKVTIPADKKNSSDVQLEFL